MTHSFDPWGQVRKARLYQFAELNENDGSIKTPGTKKLFIYCQSNNYKRCCQTHSVTLPEFPGSIFLLSSKTSSVRDSTPMKQKVMASCSDLIQIFRLPCVVWWTLWALAVTRRKKIQQRFCRWFWPYLNIIRTVYHNIRITYLYIYMSYRQYKFVYITWLFVFSLTFGWQ